MSEAVKKDSLEPKTKAMVHCDLGTVQMYTGDFENSLTNLKTAMNLMPNKKLYLDAINTCKSEQQKAAKLQEQI